MAVRQRPRATRLLVVTLVALSLAVITLDYREGQSGPLAVLGRGALTVIVPMQRAVNSVTRPVGNFFSGLAHLGSLEQDNQDLRHQNTDLNAQIASFTYLQQQYDALLAQMHLKGSLAPDSVPAVVTGTSPSNFEWTVTIDRGSSDGIALNMPVITGTSAGAILVGHVVEVASHASMVELIIDRNSSVAAVLGTSRQAGIVGGQGEDDMKMTLVSPGTTITGNEPVFTQGICVAGQPGLYPPGILVGEVSRTLPSVNALQAAVSVRPAADFATLQFVLVLKSRNTC